jgi:GxxExxY protein
MNPREPNDFLNHRGHREHRENEAVNALTHSVIGAAIEVHRELGPGFLETVYEQAFAVELEVRSIAFQQQCPVHVTYKQRPVGEGRLDFLVNNVLIVELKAVDKLQPIHTAQVISYLKATKLHYGLLINFNVRILTEGIRRIVFD